MESTSEYNVNRALPSPKEKDELHEKHLKMIQSEQAVEARLQQNKPTGEVE